MYIQLIVGNSDTGEVYSSFQKDINLNTDYGRTLLRNNFELLLRKLQSDEQVFIEIAKVRDIQLYLPF